MAQYALPSDKALNMSLRSLILSHVVSCLNKRSRNKPQRTHYGDIRTDLRHLLRSSLTLGHSLSTTYLLPHFHTSTKSPVSNIIPLYRTLRKKMASSNKKRSQSTHTEYFLRLKIHWSRVLFTTERKLINAVKQPLRVLPNTLLFGNAFSTYRSLLTLIHHDDSGVKPRSTQDFVDTLIVRQALFITLRFTRKQPSMRPTYVNDTLTAHETQNCGTCWKRK